jgi:hypothetical protein
MWRVRGLALAVVVALGVASTAIWHGGREMGRVVAGDGIGVAGASGPALGRRWDS